MIIYIIKNNLENIIQKLISEKNQFHCNYSSWIKLISIPRTSIKVTVIDLACYIFLKLIPQEFLNMATEEGGGMVPGLAAIAISVVFAAGIGFIILHFLPTTPF